MTEQEAFIRAVCEAPDDDTPRLICADWLEERGDPRAEFIRVQCELARLDPYHASCTGDKCPGCSTLRHRERELLGHNWYQWLGPIPEEVFCENLYQPHAGPTPTPHVTFRRGFVELITLTAADWLRHADTLMAAAPIRGVTLTTWRSAEVMRVYLMYFDDSNYEGLEIGPDGLQPISVGTGDEIDGNPDFVQRALRKRWPQIKTWNLPPQTLIIRQSNGTPGTSEWQTR